MSEGPNVKRLILERMSVEAIPKGGGIVDGIRFLLDPEKIKAGAKAATEWTRLAIQAVREACDPNPWKNSEDEAIAGEILRKLEEKRQKSKSATWFGA